MPDREKVISCLTDIEQIMVCRQEICPKEELQYWIELQEGVADGLALLKEQEGKPLRCKECSYHRNDGWCKEHRREVKESDYCSFGAWEGR